VQRGNLAPLVGETACQPRFAPMPRLASMIPRISGTPLAAHIRSMESPSLSNAATKTLRA
jgi:hypothetical protein